MKKLLALMILPLFPSLILLWSLPGQSIMLQGGIENAKIIATGGAALYLALVLLFNKIVRFDRLDEKTPVRLALRGKWDVKSQFIDKNTNSINVIRGTCIIDLDKNTDRLTIFGTWIEPTTQRQYDWSACGSSIDMGSNIILRWISETRYFVINFSGKEQPGSDNVSVEIGNNLEYNYQNVDEPRESEGELAYNENMLPSETRPSSQNVEYGLHLARALVEINVPSSRKFDRMGGVFFSIDPPGNGKIELTVDQFHFFWRDRWFVAGMTFALLMAISVVIFVNRVEFWSKIIKMWDVTSQHFS